MNTSRKVSHGLFQSMPDVALSYPILSCSHLMPYISLLDIIDGMLLSLHLFMFFDIIILWLASIFSVRYQLPKLLPSTSLTLLEIIQKVYYHFQVASDLACR